MPRSDAGNTEGHAWVVTPEGHEVAQPGWPASADQTVHQESSHERPMSVCRTPPQDPKAAVTDKSSLQKDLGQPQHVSGLPDQGSTRRQWHSVQSDQQSGNQGAARPRSHRPLHPEYSRGAAVMQPHLKRAPHSCDNLSFGASQPWQNSPAFCSWDTTADREGVTFIDSASSSDGGPEVASPLKQMPKEGEFPEPAWIPLECA